MFANICIEPVSQRLSKIYQEDDECKLKEWQRANPEDSFYFRPCNVPDDSSSVVNKSSPSDDEEIKMTDFEETLTSTSKHILFAHQTKWQKDMLLR